MLTKPEPFLRFVRLKPRPAKPRKGLPRTPGRYMFRGVRFEESRGWYQITDAVFAKELSELTHNDREDGVPIFDVMTQEQAQATQARERRSKLKREVEDAEVQTVTPNVSPRARRSSNAITTSDVRPEAEPVAEPAMIDPDPEGEELDSEGVPDEMIGKLTDSDDLGDGTTQELDDGDDLLDGEREPRAPKVVATKPPVSRKKAPTKKKKG